MDSKRCVILYFQCSERELGSSPAACKRLKDEREKIGTAGIVSNPNNDEYNQSPVYVFYSGFLCSMLVVDKEMHR